MNISTIINDKGNTIGYYSIGKIDKDEFVKFLNLQHGANYNRDDIVYGYCANMTNEDAEEIESMYIPSNLCYFYDFSENYKERYSYSTFTWELIKDK